MNRKMIFKFLTILITVLYSGAVFSQKLVQENGDLYLRWNVYCEKEQLFINKKGSKVTIKTLNVALIDEMKNDLSKIKSNDKYIKSISYLTPDKDNNSVGIEIELTSPEVEIFSFYKDRDQRYIVDFWKEKDEINTKDAALAKDVPLSVPEKNETVAQVKAENLPPLLVSKKEEVKAPVVVARKVAKKETKPEYRDFRYGASFVWDYEPFNPGFDPLLDITRKTPEFFYPIKDRDYQKDDKEAHLQLAINMFKKKNYGLMNRSLDLFQKKYGDIDNWEFIEYIKANAILRDNIDQGNREPVKVAINLLTNLIEKSDNYDLKKGVVKYLITYYNSLQQPLDSLKFCKTYYVITKENFDYEESQIALEGILSSLAQLNQIEQIKDVASDKTAIKIIPKQILLGHELFSLIKLGKIDEAIKRYEEVKKGLVKPIHPSIIFNAAEAYFRRSNLQEALTLYDEFITDHSYHERAQDARVRLGLIFEMLNKNPLETLVLYKTAINRSNDFNIQYEARLRYVALRTIRKIETDKRDLETRVFLDINDDQKKAMSKNLKKMLWLVRLRAFINDGKYHDALSYLSALPLTAMPMTEKRVFEADGAEIIYGIISDHFAKGKYSQVLKTWEIYRKDYVEKVANDPYVNFVVGKSLIRLGLYEAFEKIYQDFEKLSDTPSKTFPTWIERFADGKRGQYILELDLVKNIKLGNFDVALKRVDQLERLVPDHTLLNFYRGIVNFKRKDYKQTISFLETFISMSNSQNSFDPADVAEMMTAYTDSLYEVGELDKFQKVSEAVLADTDKFAPSNPFMANMRERLSYYQVEILAGDKKSSSQALLEKKIPDFLKNYPKSAYSSRMNYLYGMALISNMKFEEGKSYFEKMLSDGAVEGPIKELIRSELTMLTIKEKSLKTK